MRFCIKRLFHDVPLRVNKSKLVQEIKVTEFFEFYVKQKCDLFIKYSF